MGRRTSDWQEPRSEAWFLLEHVDSNHTWTRGCWSCPETLLTGKHTWQSIVTFAFLTIFPAYCWCHHRFSSAVSWETWKWTDATFLFTGISGHLQKCDKCHVVTVTLYCNKLCCSFIIFTDIGTDKLIQSWLLLINVDTWAKSKLERGSGAVYSGRSPCMAFNKTCYSLILSISHDKEWVTTARESWLPEDAGRDEQNEIMARGRLLPLWQTHKQAQRSEASFVYLYLAFYNVPHLHYSNI